MRTSLLLALVVAFAACVAEPPQHRVDVNGTIGFVALEGGFWAIRGDDGVTYDPRAFPPDFRKEGLRVHAVMNRRDDMVGVHMVGPIVDILRLDVLPCGPVPCPPPPFAVELAVFDRAGAPVSGATLANVTGPPPGPGSVTPSCATVPESSSGAPRTVCLIVGTVPGVYEADVTAPGFQTVHVRVDVPSRSILPNECCPVTYVPQRVQVTLSPAR
jgi:hypothetical protein